MQVYIYISSVNFRRHRARIWQHVIFRYIYWSITKSSLYGLIVISFFHPCPKETYLGIDGLENETPPEVSLVASAESLKKTLLVTFEEEEVELPIEVPLKDDESDFLTKSTLDSTEKLPGKNRRAGGLELTLDNPSLEGVPSVEPRGFILEVFGSRKGKAPGSPERALGSWRVTSKSRSPGEVGAPKPLTDRTPRRGSWFECLIPRLFQHYFLMIFSFNWGLGMLIYNTYKWMYFLWGLLG